MANPQVIFNPVKERIEFDSTTDANLHKAVIDLGVKFINESAWKLRFRLVINNAGIITGTNAKLWVGLSTDDETRDDTLFQNAIFMLMTQDTITAGGSIKLGSADNESLSTGPTVTFATVLNPRTLYCELQRNSFTVGNETIQLRLFSDPGYTSLIESKVIEFLDTRFLNGLQYIFFMSAKGGATTSQGMTGFIDQVQFWNNTKEVTTRIPDFIDNFDDATQWTSVGVNAPLVDNVSFPKQLKFNATQDLLFRNVSRKLPFMLSNDKWTIDFEFEATAVGPTGFGGVEVLGVHEKNTDPFVDATNLSIQVVHITGFSDPDLTASAVGLKSFFGSGSTPNLQTEVPQAILHALNVKLYVRWSRISRNSIRMEIYTDPERTVVFAGSPTADGTTNPSGNFVRDCINLTWISAGSISVGSVLRELTGTIHNLRIYNGVNADDMRRGAREIPDFADNFGYDTQATADESWPSADVTLSRVNITTSKLDFQSPLNGANASIVHDLQKELGRGVYMDDNQWLVRFKIRWSVLNFVATGVNHNFGLSAFDQTFGSNVEDIFAEFSYNHANIGNSDLGSSSGANVLHPLGAPLDSSLVKQLATATDYYFEIARTSLTTGYVRQYNDAMFTEILEEFPFTNLTKSVSGLRYFKFTNRILNVAGDSTGTIDDLEIWNGSSVPNEADKIRVKLEPFPTPANTGNKIHWTAKGSTMFTPNGTIIVNRAKAQIWEGTTLIAESPYVDLTPGWKDYEYEITATEFARIVDWNKLSITVVSDTVQ